MTPALKGRPINIDQDEILYSWRVAIIPQLEAWDGTWDHTKKWDSAHNKQINELSWAYTYGRNAPQDLASMPDTVLLAITGPGTGFGDGGSSPPMPLRLIPPQTILLIESSKSQIPWAAPGDLDVRHLAPTSTEVGNIVGLGGCGKGFHVLFADMRTYYIDNHLPLRLLLPFFTVQEAATQDREEALGPYVLRRGL